MPFVFLYTCQHLFTSQDILWFVVNEAAALAMIRGAGGLSDVDKILQLSSILLLHQLWIERVNSNFNLSDGLSRDG